MSLSSGKQKTIVQLLLEHKGNAPLYLVLDSSEDKVALLIFVIDKQRKEEFKTYEMEKEHLRREKLQALDEQKRLEEERKFQEMQKKRKDHPKLHHPVSCVFGNFRFITWSMYLYLEHSLGSTHALICHILFSASLFRETVCYYAAIL